MRWSLAWLVLVGIGGGACTASSPSTSDHGTDDDGTDDVADDGSASADPTDDSVSTASTEPTGTSVTTTSPTVGDSEDGTSDGTAADTSSADATRGTDDTTASSSDSTGETHNEACAAGCIVEFACQDSCDCSTMWASEAECVQWCEANLVEAAMFGAFCHDAWQAISACFGTLSCEEYHDYYHPPELDYPCVSEADALAFECSRQ